jgi:hypothetical protein
MGQWHTNQGWNRNLLVHLSGGPSYQLDVYVVALFRFFFPREDMHWTAAEQASWKQRYANLVYRTWSEKWRLLSDISCEPIDVERTFIHEPTARVRVHVVDVENPSVRLPMNQRLYLVKVHRVPPRGEPRGRQHASALEPSRATVRDADHAVLPAGAVTAELYEDSLELDPPDPIDGHRQFASMHEFGHMLGMMHPNDMASGCQIDRSAPVCYGDPYSVEADSIMGRGQEVRPVDYTVFARIISHLVREVPQAGISALLGGTHRLLWMVEGTLSRYCAGQYEGTPFGGRPSFTRAHARRPGSYGLG